MKKCCDTDRLAPGRYYCRFDLFRYHGYILLHEILVRQSSRLASSSKAPCNPRNRGRLVGKRLRLPSQSNQLLLTQEVRRGSRGAPETKDYATTFGHEESVVDPLRVNTVNNTQVYNSLPENAQEASARAKLLRDEHHFQTHRFLGVNYNKHTQNGRGKQQSASHPRGLRAWYETIWTRYACRHIRMLLGG